MTMRKRFNRGAVCSSENYSASRKAHLSFLKEKHESFCGMMISGELHNEVPSNSNTVFTAPKYKTIKVFGKEMILSNEEYNNYYAKCNF